ncbi:MAG: NAD(P)/FAD-dependent oxidoreductase [Candidatus Humimicrobiaceae bacterium]
MRDKIKRQYDIIIIGAGIMGCLIARELSFYGLDIAVFEKSSYICSGQSKGNGAIVHAGHNEKPGSLKAKLCVEGNRRFEGLCNDLGIFFKRTGYTLLAFDSEQIKILKRLEEQGKINGVRTKVLDAAGLIDKEPNASRETLSALHIVDAGLTDVFRLVIAAAEHAAVNGVDFILGTEVEGLLKDLLGNERISGVTTSDGNWKAGLVINCAGVDADTIIRSAVDTDFKISARKAEYYIIDKAEGNICNGAIYPIPTPYGKGCAVIPTVHGNTIFGGNSILTGDREDTSTSSKELENVLTQSEKLVPAVKGKKVIAQFSGLRSSVEGDDYIIGPQKGAPGLFNIVGIDSPGLSSAPAIASYVKDMIGKNYFDLKKDPGKTGQYQIKPLFKDLDMREKKEWIKHDRRYGRIVCRCENITEGDIVSAIHAPIPALTTDAIKFKVWAGAGRCQGAFDISRIITILSDETGIKPPRVIKRGRGSNIVTGYTRDFSGQK